MTRFDYYHHDQFLTSEYPDTTKPDFKIHLDIQKSFYKESNGWNTEYSHHSLETLEIKMSMVGISNNVVTYKSYKIMRYKDFFEYDEY